MEKAQRGGAVLVECWRMLGSESSLLPSGRASVLKSVGCSWQ